MSSGNVAGNRDALAAFLEPSGLIARNMCQHVVIYLSDKAVIFKYRNKLVRRHETHIGCLPSDECFGTRMFVGTRVVLRLIVNEEFFVIDCSLLTVRNGVDPLFFINEIAVEKRDSGVSNF